MSNIWLFGVQSVAQGTYLNKLIDSGIARGAREWTGNKWLTLSRFEQITALQLQLLNAPK